MFYDSKLVLSAVHSVEREEDIQILMADGSRRGAKVAGRDPLVEPNRAVLEAADGGFGLLPANASEEEVTAAIRAGIRRGLLEL